MIGLAPWLPAEESSDTLVGKHLRVAHAELDWVCSFASMQTFLDRAQRVTASIRTESMGRDVHEMLFEKRWHDFTAREVLSMVRGAAI